jgi:hypothetical protein
MIPKLSIDIIPIYRERLTFPLTEPSLLDYFQCLRPVERHILFALRVWEPNARKRLHRLLVNPPTYGHRQSASRPRHTMPCLYEPALSLHQFPFGMHMSAPSGTTPPPHVYVPNPSTAAVTWMLAPIQTVAAAAVTHARPARCASRRHRLLKDSIEGAARSFLG